MSGTPYQPSKPGENREYIVGFEPPEEERAALDTQVGGPHYKNFKIQPVEFAMANNLNYCQSNVVKYVCRYPMKNGLEDLKKAKHYIDLLIELEFGNGNVKEKEGKKT